MRAFASMTLFALTALLILPAQAQQVRVLDGDAWCDRSGWSNDDDEQYCEVREITLPAGRKLIEVDGRQNGGIRVKGWNRDEILIRAKVVGSGRSRVEARDRVRAVTIETGGIIHADASNQGNRKKTSVSYEIYAPRRSNVSLETHNGGIQIAGIDGHVRFDALNGGVSLVDLAGYVEGRTTNGGLDIELTGQAWQGEGLDVETQNGGVEIRIPDGYSARLETGTVNGKVHFDFPVMMQGRLDRRISTDLGTGGKRIRAVTTNGGVRVRRG